VVFETKMNNKHNQRDGGSAHNTTPAAAHHTRHRFIDCLSC
jgi:hypothetical protein